MEAQRYVIHYDPYDLDQKDAPTCIIATAKCYPPKHCLIVIAFIFLYLYKHRFSRLATFFPPLLFL